MKKNGKNRILVTGGAGFLGSHLCERFLAEGHEVLCLDNLITGTPDNIAHLRSTDFTFIHYDVTNYMYVEGPLDFVVHFASPASPIDYQKYPIQTLKVGSLGTHKALGLAKAKGATFVFASSSEVYGDPKVHPQPENYWGHVNCVGPRGMYDESKRFSEAMAMAYHRAHRVDIRLVRIFNTYGPRMRACDGRAIPTFIPQALHGAPITVFGDGSQTRSFCFVDDLVEGIYHLMFSGYTQPINIGNPNEMTILELAQGIIKLTGSKSEIIYNDLPADDPKVRQPDITRAREVLGWEPKVSLRDGLAKTIEWFEEKLG